MRKFALAAAVLAVMAVSLFAAGTAAADDGSAATKMSHNAAVSDVSHTFSRPGFGSGFGDRRFFDDNRFFGGKRFSRPGFGFDGGFDHRFPRNRFFRNDLGRLLDPRTFDGRFIDGDIRRFFELRF